VVTHQPSHEGRTPKVEHSLHSRSVYAQHEASNVARAYRIADVCETSQVLVLEGIANGSVIVYANIVGLQDTLLLGSFRKFCTQVLALL
jgi:hypothetical protein